MRSAWRSVRFALTATAGSTTATSPSWLSSIVQENGWGYRVSSALFPVLTHPDFKYDITDVPQYQEIVDCLRETAEYNESWRVRLSTHPDQFNVLASENQSSVDKTIAELNHHGWVMDMLGCERSYQNPMNIHVNCTKGDLADIAARFMSIA